MKTLGYVPFGTGRFRPFDQVYQQGIAVNAEDVLAGKVDGVVIWGGADISPTLYKQKPHRMCGAGEKLSERDAYEKAVFEAAVKVGIPIIGVCRGAQLACALSGGRLVQHVNGHAGGHHLIDTIHDKFYETSSVHHQMMYPYEVEHELIGWSSERRSDVYYDEGGDMEEALEKPEAEIVYFPHTKALAIQGHPEFMPDDCDFVLYCNDLVREYLL